MFFISVLHCCTYCDGVISISALKHLVKYFGSVKPTLNATS